MGKKGNYKYLEILVVDTVKQTKPKEKIRKEYLRRTSKSKKRKPLENKKKSERSISGEQEKIQKLVSQENKKK